MRRFRAVFGTLLLLAVFGAPAMATHIVGGSISYRCLGNDQYEITLRVYRDCFNGDPGAAFDDPAAIGVFDRAGLLVDNILVPFIKEDTVTNRPEACLVVPENVCVHTTTYVTTVELPFKEGGYQLVHQRCCRNVTVQNVVEPLETGATYDIWLTEEAMLSCNSSPVFKDWPPIFICVNEPLNFDHSAIDADGDSLVYSLCMPIQGGTFAEPKPQPPNPPPYDEVMLVEPTYSIDNFLGFGDPLKIDNQNGQMTVTPAVLGQFVVGVCVEEYDRETGELLSRSRRDFQYNVIQCEPLEANFQAPDAICDDFTLTLISGNPDADEFFWNITGEDTVITSREPNPMITFPATGTYNVQLTVDPNSVCESTITKEILVATNTIQPDFRIDALACADSAFLFLIDQSSDSIADITNWEWLISPDNADAFTVTGRFPVVTVPTGSSGSIQLILTSDNTCINNLVKRYEAPGVDIRRYLQDTIYTCTGAMVSLNPRTPSDVRLNYSWTGPGLDDPTAINPMITAQSGTTRYQVEISGPPNTCLLDAEVVVIASDDPELDFQVASNCEGLSYHFEDLSADTTSNIWIIGDLSAPILISEEANFDFTFTELGSYNVYLISQAACADTLVQTIEVNNNDLDVGVEVVYTDCVDDLIEVQLMSQTATTDSIIRWDWALSDGRTSTEANPVFTFSESTSLTVSLTVETLQGCIDSVEQEIEVNLLTDIAAQLPDTLALCEGTPTALFPENDDKYTYQWSPVTGVDDPNSSNPIFLESGVYTVTISIPGSPTCNVVTQVAAVLPPVINLDLSVAELADDLLADLIDENNNGAGNTDLSMIDPADLSVLPITNGMVVSCDQALLLTATTGPETTVTWYLNGEEVTADDLRYLADTPGENTYMAIATDAFGCMDTSRVVIDLQGVDIELPDQVAVCDGELINITAENTDSNDNLDYSWTPAEWINSGQGTATVDVVPPIGINYVIVEVENQNGCVTIDSVEVVVVDPNHDLDFELGPLCSGTTVTFNNRSENAFGYLWDFGDPNNPDATSTEDNPRYTYTEPGTYTALLTLQYDVSCRDSIEKTFTITDSTAFDADFTIDLVDCQPGVATYFIEGQATLPDSVLTYTYMLEDGRTFNGKDFTLMLTEGMKQNLTLTVTSTDSCSTTVTKMIEFPVVDINLPDTTVLCDPAGITLNPGGSEDYMYDWDLVGGILDSSVVSPFVQPAVTTTYPVTITANGFEACVVEDSVTVVVPDERLMPDLPDTLYTDGDPITIETMVDAETYTWTDSSGQVISTDASVLVDPACEAYYYLQMTDEYGCEYIDSVLVINRGIEVEITPPSPVTICDGDEVQLMVEDLKGCDTLSFIWGPDSLVASGGNTANPVFSFDKEGTYQGTGIVSNQYGTVDTLFVDFTVGTIESGLMDTVVLCYQDSINLGPNTNPDYTYTWSPGDNLDDANSNNPLFTGRENVTYTVTVTDGICEVIDTVTVIVPDERIVLDLPDTLYTDGDAITIETMIDAETYTWTDTSGQVIGTGPSISVDPDCEAIYYLEVTDKFGCAYTDSVVVINRGIEVEITPPSPVTICDGDEVQIMVEDLKGCDTLSFVWGPDSLIASGGNTANPIFTFDKEGMYQGTGIITNQYGTTDTLVVDFIVGTIESGLMDTVVLCNQDSVNLGPNTNPDYTYTWSPGDNLDDPNSNNPLFTGTESTIYLVTVTDGDCEVEDTVTVIVPDERLVLDLPDTVYTGGDTVILETMVDGVRFTWTDEDGQVIGTDRSIAVDPECEAIYYLEVVDEYGCEYMDTVVVINEAIEVVVLPESPITLCVDDEIQIMVENLKDCDTLSYSWGPDSILVSGGNTATPVFSFDEAGNFQATGIVTNKYGTTDTILVEFNVGNLEGLGLMSPLQGCIGDAFNLFPGADTSLTYVWSPADLLDDPNAPNPLTLPLNSDTTFLVKVTLPGTTCMIEDTVVVDVKDDILLDITADPGLMVCPQTTVKLEASLEEGAMITWLDADGNLLGTADTLDVEVLEEPIEITAVARDTNGCEQTQVLTLTPEDLDLGLDSLVEACAEIPTELNPNGNPAYLYEWSPAENLDLSNPHNPIATLSEDQTFDVVVTDTVTGCIVEKMVAVDVIEHPSITLTTNDTMICEPVPITLMAETDQPTTLEWFSDAAMMQSLGTGNNIEVLPGEGFNQYFVKTADSTCVDLRDVDTVTVEVVDFTVVAPDTLLEICKGDRTELNPRGDDRFSYQWEPTDGLDDPTSPNPMFDGNMEQTFMVTITSPDGMCSTTRMQQVNLNDPVNLDAGQDTILCMDGSFTLTASHEGGQNVMWAEDRDFTQNVLQGDTLEVDLVEGGQYYYVKADNGMGCTEIDSVLVGSGLIDAMLPESILICDASEGAVVMVMNNRPNQELSYLWAPEEKLESDPLQGPTAMLLPGEEGLISVMLENQYGCTAELSTMVNIDDVASARITASDTVIQVGNPVQLMVEDCEDCQYEWSPAETIDNPNAGSVMATPLETTEYSVTVTKGDCETILRITIVTEGVLCSEENIFIPRAFTPNGDNQNDVLFVRSNVIDELNLMIYNRWGQEVFKTQSEDIGWDGTFRGNELPPDVYGYYLEAVCIDGSEIVLQGNVTLLR